MKNVFELAFVDGEQVVLKVNADDNFIVATHPYISGEYEYITVTRGSNHILTVIKKNGSTFDFNWGSSGYTLISDGLERLKKEVCRFIEKDCHILLEYDDSPVGSVDVFFNKNYNMWQMTVRSNTTGRTGMYWSKTAKDVYDMFEEARQFGYSGKFEHNIAQTGIDVWTMTA